MTDQVSPAQIRGARAMLDWSVTDLAKAASVSISTVKRVETNGMAVPSDDGRTHVACALERAGATFIGDDGRGPGVRLRGG